MVDSGRDEWASPAVLQLTDEGEERPPWGYWETEEKERRMEISGQEAWHRETRSNIRKQTDWLEWRHVGVKSALFSGQPDLDSNSVISTLSHVVLVKLLIFLNLYFQIV